MNELIEGLKHSLAREDNRYVYADQLTNSLVSAQIKSLREDRDLSQQELAELIGTKQSGISRLEKADYSTWKIETLRKLARAFGVRLRISFDEFGTLPTDVTGFTKERLCPRRFEDDPIFIPKNESETAARSAEALDSSGSPTEIFRRQLIVDLLASRNGELEPDDTSPAGNDYLWTEGSMAALRDAYPNVFALMQALDGSALAAGIDTESPLSERNDIDQAVDKGPAELFLVPKQPGTDMANPLNKKKRIA